MRSHRSFVKGSGAITGKEAETAGETGNPHRGPGLLLGCLALVERAFRTLKTGHLDFRPWLVCTEENPQAQALTSMLAWKVRRHWERAWWPLEVTVEAGLREWESLCAMELVHGQSGEMVARPVPQPNRLQQKL